MGLITYYLITACLMHRVRPQIETRPDVHVYDINLGGGLGAKPTCCFGNLASRTGVLVVGAHVSWTKPRPLKLSSSLKG